LPDATIRELASTERATSIIGFTSAASIVDAQTLGRNPRNHTGTAREIEDVR
jgi:hypothetical protein